MASAQYQIIPYQNPSHSLPSSLRSSYGHSLPPPSITLKACFPESAAVCNYLHTYAGVSGGLCKDTLFLKFHVQLPKGPCKET